MVVGYREWVLIGDELISPLARTPWDAGALVAECLPACREARGLWRQACEHDGPAPDLWGRIEVHHRGLRAEFARVVALSLPHDRHAARLIRRVADRLEVEAVPARDLQAAARAYGSPVAPDLIPAA